MELSKRLTAISEITGLPMPIALQESCGEDSCSDACETAFNATYENSESDVDACATCPIQECMTKLHELEKAYEEGRLVIYPLPDKASVFIPNHNKGYVYEGIIYHHNTRLHKGILRMVVTVPDSMGMVRYFTEEDIGKTIFLTPKEAEAQLDTRCLKCKHDCNEDCGHPEKTNGEYEKENEFEKDTISDNTDAPSNGHSELHTE